MSWISNSVMGRKAVAKGKPGARHLLSEADQGMIHDVYGPYADPALRISPGNVVEVETVDAFGGAIKSETDLPSAVLNMPFVNPQNGPIAVEGDEKAMSWPCISILSCPGVRSLPEPRR